MYVQRIEVMKRKIRFRKETVVCLLLFALSSGVAGANRQSPPDLVGLRQEVALYCDAEFENPSDPEYPKCGEAIRKLENMARRDEDPAVLLLLMEAYRNRSWERGIEIAKRLVELVPERGEPYLFLALRSSDPRESLRYYEEASRRLPENPWVHGQLARARMLAHAPVEEVLAALEAQVLVSADYSAAILATILGLAERGHDAAAKRALELYLGSDLPVSQKCTGILNLTLRPLVVDPEFFPRFKELCQGYGLVEVSQTETDSARRLTLLRAAVRLSPEHPYAHGLLAWALIEDDGNVSEALKEMGLQVERSDAYEISEACRFVDHVAEIGHVAEAAELVTRILSRNLPAAAVCECFSLVEPERFLAFEVITHQLEKTCPQLTSAGRETGS